MGIVREMLLKAIEIGCKAYMVEGHNSFGYIVTPNGNVLGVNKATWGTGVNFCLEYNPDQKTGRGCSCHASTEEWDFGIRNLDAKTLNKLEKEGLKYAHQLKAKLYKNPEEWMESTYWNGRGLRQISA